MVYNWTKEKPPEENLGRLFIIFLFIFYYFNYIYSYLVKNHSLISYLVINVLSLYHIFDTYICIIYTLFRLFSFSFFFICRAFSYHSIYSFICIFAADAGKSM